MGLVRLVLYVFSPLLRYATHPDDTKDDRIRKSLLIPVVTVGSVNLVLVNLVSFLQGYIGLYSAGAIAVSLFNIAFLSVVFSTKRCSQRLAGTWIAAVGTWCIVADVFSYGLVEYYTIAVVVMDALLLCNCSQSFSKWIFSLTVAIILVSTVEQCWRPGLYDQIPEEWSGYDRPEKRGGSYVVNLLVQRLFVFTADYSMTRHFSFGMRSQRSQVESSIAVAQQIASALARFDLNKAEEMVVGAEGLPLELLDALSCLLGNLRTYKPYLPQSCLPDISSAEGSSDHSSISSQTSVGTRPAINTLKSKMVTLVQVNVRGFLRRCEAGSASIPGYHSLFLSSVVEVARNARGVVEYFNSDRVLVSFNAARSCMKHRLQSVVFAERLTAAPLHHDSLGSSTSHSLSLSIASGCVLHGPLGYDGLRMYSLVGSVAAWVPVLERVAVQLNVPVIMDSSVHPHVRDVCMCRLLGLASFEKNKQRRLHLYEFLGMQEGTGDDWMHVGRSTHELYNEALGHLLVGDPETAFRVAQSGLDMKTPSHATLLCKIQDAMKADITKEAFWKITDVGISEVEVKADSLRRKSRTSVSTILL